MYLRLYERGIKSVIRRGAGFRGAAHATTICGAINKRVNAASFAGVYLSARRVTAAAGSFHPPASSFDSIASGDGPINSST